MTAHRQRLSQVMTLAWSRYRFAILGGSRALSFSEALRGAWRWVKDEGARAAAAAAWATNPRPIVHLRSPVSSAISRRLGTGWQDRNASRLTSRIGY